MNALHSLFHVAWGVFGLAAYRGITGVRRYARATAMVYGMLTIMGLVSGQSTLFGLLPL